MDAVLKVPRSAAVVHAPGQVLSDEAGLLSAQAGYRTGARKRQMGRGGPDSELATWFDDQRWG